MGTDKKTTVELDATSADTLAFLKGLYGSQTEAFKRALARERAHAERMAAYQQFIDEFNVTEDELEAGRRWWTEQQDKLLPSRTNAS